MIQNYDYEVQTSYTLYLFFIFLSLCLYYVTDLIKKLIKFGHAQISVPKMSIPISKTASVKPWFIIDKMKSY